MNFRHSPAWLPTCIAIFIFLSLSSVGITNAAQNGLHPQLFFTDSDIQKLKDESDTNHSDIWASITHFVDSQIGTAPPLVVASSTDEVKFRDYANQLIPYAFACALTSKASYCE